MGWVASPTGRGTSSTAPRGRGAQRPAEPAALLGAPGGRAGRGVSSRRGQSRGHGGPWGARAEGKGREGDSGLRVPPAPRLPVWTRRRVLNAALVWVQPEPGWA